MNAKPYQIVLDTNVIVTGFRSNRGASYKLLSILNDERWQINLSVSLVLEYEAVLKRQQSSLNLSLLEIDQAVEDICSIANLRSIFYTWRPMSRDPDDDFLVDLAVKCQADFIVTYNGKDFTNISNFGIRVVTPKQFLEIVGEL
ncbi:MAG: putative toxin-antitoxin system toxin component, PIN family [Phormidesmis sp.]